MNLSLLNITGYRRFNQVAERFSSLFFRGVLGTPPVHSDLLSDRMLYTLLCKRQVRAYLLALKSFLRFCPELNFRIVVQSDGSLDAAAHAELQGHVNGISVHGVSECRRFLEHHVPAAVWQSLPDLSQCCFLLPLKLLNLFYRFRGRYVVVFDSDLLFLRRPQEVVECMLNSEYRAFHLAGGSALAEPFHRIGFDLSRVDIRRFNSGFAGFRNSFSDEHLVSILRAIAKHDRSLFGKWEIEQAIWGVLLNYCPNPLNVGNLGKGYVGNGWRSYRELKQRAAIVHFVGSTRYRNLNYLRLARAVMRELRECSGSAVEPLTTGTTADAR